MDTSYADRRRHRGMTPAAAALAIGGASPPLSTASCSQMTSTSDFFADGMVSLWSGRWWLDDLR
jgi:hypothetical protein